MPLLLCCAASSEGMVMDGSVVLGCAGPELCGMPCIPFGTPTWYDDDIGDELTEGCMDG